MDSSKISDLRHFVHLCKSNPSLLHHPSLAFFKSYLDSLGAEIPPTTESKEDKSGVDMSDPGEHFDAKKSNLTSEDDDEIVESDIELDNTDIVEPDNDPPQKMGDPSVEVTEEMRDAANAAKLKAMDSISEGKPDEAIDQLTEAIMLNPTSAILYAARAGVFIKLNKPNAAVRDANEALQINPDSAKGYKVRGMARAMLGQWEEATNDLHVASKLDYDEEIGSVLKKVEPNVRKLQEHRRKYEKLRKEKDLKKAEREKQKRQAEAEREALSALKEGDVMAIHSIGELETKMNAATRTSRLAIMYFTATWCGPCRFISPVYTSFASKYPKVVFLKVDIDEARDVAAKWNISSVPTFFFIKNGKEVDTLVGTDKSALEKKIAQHAGQ
ncbi:TPR repeat-containing thioredoxin TDX [Pistacia vera]|uniref:TPR repeat-containing thioredoxin TDX n=1 Tax=Pistacia vera TaxID=55513 RepID=UPI001262C805|nr:TPR repeat-containing thioredoxin TDX [Pistacia vera]